PEQAIIVYESSLELNPEATILACKIGNALVKTHDYNRAIQYYESALINDSSIVSSLRIDLATLYKKLQQFEEAERIILENLQHPKSEDISVQTNDVKSKKPDKSINALLRAREIQIHLVTMDPNDKLRRIIASDICFRLAELFSKELKDTEKSQAYFNESIQYHNLNKKAMLSLARLYSEKNDTTSAQNQCAAMLRLDVGNEEATMMIADIMIQKNTPTSALFHLKQLLDKNPIQYEALSKCIDASRRSGKLEDVEGLLLAAEKFDVKFKLHPGYHFCSGLFHRFLNNPNEALKEFNQIRKDTVWGERAIYQMIEIFLNPDNDTVGGEALEKIADSTRGNKTDSELLALLTADKLIKELRNPDALMTHVLECRALMVSKQKPEIERALGRLMDLLNADRNYVPALFGLAVAHMLLKQPPKARNQLKRIAKMDWSPEFSEYFEKSWLLLADIYIQGGKFDLATELLKKILQHNRSCIKAWEYQGYIMEKEASYKDAADHYEKAWKIEKESNATMGYKLAFNYLKAKRYVEAIEVSQKVLLETPDYPKIRKEILEKARMMVRV
ncbi:Tetratricopeptide repeat protein 21B, partial [Nowakowskiella sp. JEL0078]